MSGGAAEPVEGFVLVYEGIARADRASDSPWNVRSRTGRRASDKGLLPLTLEKYLELLDWTGRQLREGKRGAIPEDLDRDDSGSGD